jgi:hypothetical protein
LWLVGVLALTLVVFDEMTFAGTMNDDSSFGLTPFDLVFAAAVPCARPPAGLQHLWQLGFAAQVLGTLPIAPQLQLLPDWTERVPPAIEKWIDAASSKRPLVAEDFNVDVKLRSFKARRTAPISLTAKEERLRSRHLDRWLSFIYLHPSASLVGKQLLSAAEKDAKEILSDVFFDRRTATLGARIGSLWIYARWCQSIGMPDADIVPIRESVAYTYCRELAIELAPATRASRFREAVALAQYILGMDHSETLASRRVSGSALKSFERKRLLRQRDPLTCPMVHLLERIVLEDIPDATIEDRVVAGHALFLVFTRARHMDAQYVFEEPVVDGPYLEAVTSRTKTSNAKGKRRKKLTLVGLAQGLADRQWAVAWITLRQQLALSAAADQPLLPLPVHDVGDGLGWTSGEVTSFDMGLHLRHIFVKFGFEPSALKNIGSHSLKATMLSWAAKGGLPKDDRRILGYHADSNDRSVADYSRDVYAEPLRALAVLVGKIAGGLFDPDASRSGMWVEVVPEREDSPASDRLLPSASDGELSAAVPRTNSTNSFIVVDAVSDQASVARSLDAVSSAGSVALPTEPAPIAEDRDDSSQTREESVESSWSSSSSEEQQQGENALSGRRRAGCCGADDSETKVFGECQWRCMAEHPHRLFPLWSRSRLGFASVLPPDLCAASRRARSLRCIVPKRWPLALQNLLWCGDRGWRSRWLVRRNRGGR